MILTIKEVLTAVESGALDRLIKQAIPAAGAWKLRRTLRLLRAEYMEAVSARGLLFTEANSVPVNGAEGLRQIIPAQLEAYRADPLFSQSIELATEPITTGDIGAAVISVEDLEALGPLVE